MLCSGPSLDDEDEDIENKPDVNRDDGGDAKPSKSSQQKTGEALLRHVLNSEFVDGSSFSFR